MHTLFQPLGLPVVQYHNPEPIPRVVLVAGRADGIQDQVVVLAAARHKDIHSRDVVGGEAQLGPPPLLEGPHGPDVVHHGGDGDGDLNGDEDPGRVVDGVASLLGPDDAGDAQAEVGQVERRVGEDEERDEPEEEALPAVPKVDVVAVVEVDDGFFFLDPFLGQAGGGRLVEKVG